MLNMRVVNEEAYKYLIVVLSRYIVFLTCTFESLMYGNPFSSFLCNRYWSRSRFTSQAICDTLDNNISESFNNVIVHPKAKLIITMLEDIRLYLMK
ncbi:hypothetical protein VIGAN_10077000 [Vigna angularis var. angularis]|uniref:Uncharacterized protein n=1 Tax=Vigna angularis var. angularis TaxID=157739 RepID=A0A0S3T379_PHAAN|nr:hypothetical protein VIGAN_10077000 [Vigna angularis var. angularis]